MSTTTKQRVMLVDDDLTIIETLQYNLNRHGYETVTFNNGSTALAALSSSESPDLIILDWMLPDMVGPEICKVIRSRSIEVPILMLTGRAAPADVAEGLTSGADDYLAKPFSTVELMARVQAVLRRVKGVKKGASTKLIIGDLVLDEDSRRVTKKGKNVDLSPKEFQLLKVLMSNSGKTLSTESLLNQVWGYDFTGDVKTVAVHVRWLRQKLEADPKNPQLLETVHRSGYRLNAPEVEPGDSAGTANTGGHAS